jgi:hypothetical protein
MIREYVNNVNATQDSWFVSDPYYYIRIDSINHGSDGIQKYGFGAFSTTSSTTQNGTYTDDTAVSSGDARTADSWYYLANNSSKKFIKFTKTITVPRTGRYLIEMMLDKLPKVDQSAYITLTVDNGSTPLYNQKGYRAWEDSGCVARCPIKYLTAGTHQIDVVIPKYAKASWFKISELNRFQGGKDLVDDSEISLDLIKCSFTQNGVNELDTAQIVVAMKQDFFNDELGTNPLAFDLGDHVTIVLGQDNETAMPMFGGYIQGWSINDNQTELTLTCVDRLWDLKRAVVWRNFYIGSAPKDVSTGSMNYTRFSSVNQIARYLATALYEIDYNSVTQEYILYNSFSQQSDVSDLIVDGFDIKWETTFGHPGTCARLIPGQPGLNELKLYSSYDRDWDASIYSTFSFDYYASGAGVKYPMKFNIEIDMYQSGEDYTAAKTYVIHMNGPSPDSSKISLANATPILNGQWQKFQIDLDAAFDKVAPSSNYYIKEVRLVGYQPSSTVLNRRCSSLYLDQIMAFTSVSKAPSYKSADSKTALEELQDLCDKCNHVAYVRPGMERADDILLVLPRRYYTIPVTIDDSNIISLSNLEYKPVDWNIVNYAIDSYNLKDKSSIGWVKAFDMDSEKNYGIIMNHEYHSDVTSVADAKTACEDSVNGMMSPGFDITMKGNTLLEPGQYIRVQLPKYYVNGTYEITAITHNIDFVNKNFQTELNFTRPSGNFRKMLALIKNTNKDLQNLKNNAAYGTAGSLAAGMSTSLGAYGGG